MSVEITARHLNISPILQAYARKRAEALLAEFPKTEFVHVILDSERHNYIAEVVAQHKGMAQVKARETSEDMIAAIDAAALKAEKQIRKRHQKLISTHRKP